MTSRDSIRTPFITILKEKNEHFGFGEKEGIKETKKEKLNMDPLTIGCSLFNHIHELVMNFICLFLSLFLEISPLSIAPRG